MHINQIFLIHFSAVGHLNWFYNLAIVSRPAENSGVLCGVLTLSKYQGMVQLGHLVDLVF